jgi:hypothetical protein
MVVIGLLGERAGTPPLHTIHQTEFQNSFSLDLASAISSLLTAKLHPTVPASPLCAVVYLQGPQPHLHCAHLHNRCAIICLSVGLNTTLMKLNYATMRKLHLNKAKLNLHEAIFHFVGDILNLDGDINSCHYYWSNCLVGGFWLHEFHLYGDKLHLREDKIHFQGAKLHLYLHGAKLQLYGDKLHLHGDKLILYGKNLFP